MKTRILAMALLAIVFFPAISSAQMPDIGEVNPIKGTVGSKVTIAGESFSQDPAGNIVRFGDVVATVLKATNRSLIVTVPDGAQTGEITVEVDGKRSSGYRFEVIPSLEFVLQNKNLKPGQTTKGVIRVKGTRTPWKMEVCNKYTDIVELKGGNTQIVSTSGGTDNKVDVEVKALKGGDYKLQCRKIEEVALAVPAPEAKASPEEALPTASPAPQGEPPQGEPSPQSVQKSPEPTEKPSRLEPTPSPASPEPKASVDISKKLAYIAKLKEKIPAKKKALESLQKQVEKAKEEYGRKRAVDDMEYKKNFDRINADGKALATQLVEAEKKIAAAKKKSDEAELKILEKELKKIQQSQESLRNAKQELNKKYESTVKARKDRLAAVVKKRDNLEKEIKKAELELERVRKEVKKGT